MTNKKIWFETLKLNRLLFWWKTVQIFLTNRKGFLSTMKVVFFALKKFITSFGISLLQDCVIIEEIIDKHKY